jgi:hypothetical protein
VTRPIYQHPLAYLIGLEGVALLRAFAGEYDREFTQARLVEVRRLLESADNLGDGAVVEAACSSAPACLPCRSPDMTGRRRTSRTGCTARATTWPPHSPGLQVRRCIEPTYADEMVAPDSKSLELTRGPGEPPNAWALQTWAPTATNAAYRGNPVAIVWHFQLAATTQDVVGAG